MASVTSTYARAFSDVVFEADLSAGQTLLLNAQRHHNISAEQRHIQVVTNGDARSQGLCDFRSNIGRTTKNHLRSTFGE